eukprot:g5772.t1
METQQSVNEVGSALGGPQLGTTTSRSGDGGAGDVGSGADFAEGGGFAAPPGGGGSGSGGDIPASMELLHYYRSRIEEFEGERQLFLAKFAEVQVSHEDMHRLQWELRMRQDEIQELQKALSDANVFLVDEREQVARLHAENEQLKIQEMDDRRRIAHLLALSKPVAQEVTFFRDCRPGKMTRFPIGADRGIDALSQSNALASRGRAGPEGAARVASGTAGTASGTAGGPGGESKHGGDAAAAAAAAAGESGSGFELAADESGRQQQQQQQQGDASGPLVVGTAGNSGMLRTSSGGRGGRQPYKNRVLRTVYLPSEKADTLVLTVEALRGELKSVKELSEARAQTLLEDRKRRQEEEDLRATADKEAIVALQNKVSKANEHAAANMKEYLVLRHNSQVATRLLKEENEMLRAQLQHKIQDLHHLTERSRMEGDAIRSSAVQEGEMYAEQFRRQAQAREEDLTVLKQQYAQVQGMYEARVGKLEGALGKLRGRHKALLDRRALDFEGFGNDVTALRRQLERMELLFVKAVQRAAQLAEQQRSRRGGGGSGSGSGLDDSVGLDGTFGLGGGGGGGGPNTSRMRAYLRKGGGGGGAKRRPLRRKAGTG